VEKSLALTGTAKNITRTAILFELADVMTNSQSAVYLSTLDIWT